MQTQSQGRSRAPERPSLLSKYAVQAIAVLGAAAIALSFFAQYRRPTEPDAAAVAAQAAAPTQTGVYINEVMSSNESAVADSMGRYSDYVEVVNAGDEAVNLAGWMLADRAEPAVESTFTFPEQVLAPGAVLLVVASGDLQNAAGAEYRAPFKVSSAGETICLFDPFGAAADQVEVPALEPNQCYARDPETREWSITGEYTPRLANTADNHASLVAAIPMASGDLKISELMADNATYALGDGGAVADYAELYNAGDRELSLSGYTLTDDSAKPAKWAFPAASIPAGGYLLIRLSNDGDGDGMPTADFQLSASGEQLLLYNDRAQLIDKVSFGALEADQALSLSADGSYVTNLKPTPGYENTEEGARAVDRALRGRNARGIFISEVVASTRAKNVGEETLDWLELYNAGSETLPLAGWGLSDKPSRPRKWTFPDGYSIGPGERKIVYLSGHGRASPSKGIYTTNFKLGADKGESITLCTPDGAIVDRVPLGRQYAEVSYGRVGDTGDLAYFAELTPERPNAGQHYAGRAPQVAFSHVGGIVRESAIQVALAAPDDCQIYYTTDCTNPSASSRRYEGPLSIDKTTVIRAVAYRDGYLPSYSSTVTYLFGVKHVMPVVCVVTEPDNLWSDEKGIYVKGPNALAKFPYGSINRGANFWMRWERDAHVEMYELDGSQTLSQGTGLSLHGQYSRTEEQKAFSLTARAAYGDSLFRAALFPNRDYTEYRSFLLRSSGNDVKYSHMCDAVLTSLAKGLDLMYQDNVPVIVYLNGAYWGQYNLRERVNPYSIAQWEGWPDRSVIDVVKANTDTRHGSNESFDELLKYIKAHGIRTQKNLDYVAERVDIDNYLTYVAFQMYVGNNDLLNVRRYRNAVDGDGRWRWILFDLDWAFWTLDTNTVRRWLQVGGTGTDQKTDNTLFRLLMENPAIEERFFTLLGRMMNTTFDPETVVGVIEARYDLMFPEMEAQFEKFGSGYDTWTSFVDRLKNYARRRPIYMLSYIRQTMKYDKATMEKYFGEIIDKVGYTGKEGI
ncbi:MAG: hypothetical protein GX558_09200 [Clostridiales bacterium]|nr:hypothetical protein [Clostridiales bacterium]